MNVAHRTNDTPSHPQRNLKPEELSPIALRHQRLALKLSQSELGRLARVSRPKICIYELGGAPLTVNEQLRIRQALQREAERLRHVASNFEPPGLPADSYAEGQPSTSAVLGDRND